MNRPRSINISAFCCKQPYDRILARIDVLEFIHQYESNGWMVGRRKMRDWKAAVRYWESDDKDEAKPFVYEANYREEENL